MSAKSLCKMTLVRSKVEPPKATLTRKEDAPLKAPDKHMALATLWLFSAGIDPALQDTDGLPLTESLAKVLQSAEKMGRKEAASTYMKLHALPPPPPAYSGEHDIGEITGKYDVRELQELLKASGADNDKW